MNKTHMEAELRAKMKAGAGFARLVWASRT
jgi:hypothetical protein